MVENAVKAGKSEHFSTIGGIEAAVWAIVDEKASGARLDSRSRAELRNLVGEWMRETPVDVFQGEFREEAGVWIVVQPAFATSIERAARAMAGFIAG